MALIAAVVVAAIWQVKGIGSELTIPERYFREHGAYASGEADNLRLWNQLAARAAAGTISDAELSQRFESDILPFWQNANASLQKENLRLKGSQQAYALLVADFVRLRFEWAGAVIDATKNGDRSRANDALELIKQTNLAQARLERIGIRANMDHRPRALASNPHIIKIRQFLTGQHWSCIEAPTAFGPGVADTDDKRDGPSIRRALGCRAQQLFMEGDYGSLDSLMNHYVGLMADLPDGSSSFEGLTSGLGYLLRDGALPPEVALGHTADWRRSVKASIEPDLMEVAIFEDWAWSARGHGFANSVSAQTWATFAYRVEMAAAALRETESGASSNPLWYSLSLTVGLDQSLDKEHLQTIFDQGFAKFPNYRPLYSLMLRNLMPRWGGSYEMVDKFINGVYAQTSADHGFERYAELYTVYVGLEGDDLDVFRDTPAFWSGMRTGYLGLIRRYPKSDIVLNEFANFACRAGDKDEYRTLRSAVRERFSSIAWTGKHSLEACDKELLAGPSR
jgi:hypothetical protein